MSVAPDHFEDLFAGNADPWQFETRWYEARKRDLTLAALPQARYRRGYEPGCANGVLSEALAARCDSLLVSDGASAAVALARRRLETHSHVRAIVAHMPDDWPDGPFDLIVLSEIGYYLSPSAWTALLRKAQRSLARDGTLLGCHWRRRADDCAWSGDDVHARMKAELDLPQTGHWRDRDFRIDVWCAESRSVAEREGLV